MILKIYIKAKFQKAVCLVLPSKRARKIPEKIQLSKRPRASRNVR